MLTIQDVMKELGVSRYTATRILTKYFGKHRIKGTKYLVPRNHFLKWVEEGMQ